MEDTFQKQIVEALIFASDLPISENKISTIIEDLSNKQIRKIIDELNAEYLKNKRAFFITKVAGGYQINTQKQFSPWIKNIFKGRSKPRLSQAALESLAITAFNQPISRAEIDSIRGVHSGGVVRNLLERNLISIAGRSEGLGKPLLYGTTGEFLRYFGLNDISELPSPKEVDEIMGKLERTDGLSEQIIDALTDLETAEDNNNNDSAK